MIATGGTITTATDVMIAAVSSEISHSASYRDTLIVKLVVVGISGITAALHARARSAAGPPFLAY